MSLGRTLILKNAFVFMVIACVTWPRPCTGEDPAAFTIASSIDYALKHNTQILSSKEGVAAAEANKKELFTEFLPKLSATYSYTRSDEDKTFGGIITTPQDLYQFVATLTQPVFSGLSKMTQYQISALGLDMETLLARQARLNLILRVKKAYFTLLQMEKLERVAQQAVVQLAAHAEVAQNFYDVGIIPRNDVLKAEVELANARQDLIVATNDVLVAKSRFNTLLRRPVDAPLRVTDVLDYKPFAQTYAGAVETAIKSRLEIEIADLEVELAEKEAMLTKKDYFPAVDLQANYYRTGDNPDVDGGVGISDRDQWDIVATASWTFWEWGKTRYGVSENLRRLAQARLARTETEDNIRHEVKETFLRAKQTENNILTVQTAVEQAKENFRISEERYKEQVATSTEVLDAQTLLTKTQTNYFNALSGFSISKAALDRAMGVEVVN
jgi:outer membrane protein